jgi:hypothetical protein
MIKVIGRNPVKRDTVNAIFATEQNAIEFCEWLKESGYVDAKVYIA